jgi:hypothetical protein
LLETRVTTALNAQPLKFMQALEMRARRHDTPCGEGVMVWRVWGRGPHLVLLHGELNI